MQGPQRRGVRAETGRGRRAWKPSCPETGPDSRQIPIIAGTGRNWSSTCGLPGLADRAVARGRRMAVTGRSATATVRRSATAVLRFPDRVSLALKARSKSTTPRPGRRCVSPTTCPPFSRASCTSSLSRACQSVSSPVSSGTYPSVFRPGASPTGRPPCDRFPAFLRAPPPPACRFRCCRHRAGTVIESGARQRLPIS